MMEYLEKERAVLESYQSMLLNNIAVYLDRNSDLRSVYYDGLNVTISAKEGTTFTVSPAKQSGYWQIKRKNSERWKNIHFHYELLWYGNEYLALADNIELAVHLEINPEDNKAKKEDIKNKFGIEAVKNRVLYHEKLFLDFTSISNSEKSMDVVIRKLQNEPYKKWGDLAVQCVSELFAAEQ